MPQAQVPKQRTLALPGEIGRESGERHPLVSEPAKSSVTDDLRSKSIWPEIHRARDFEERRRVKCHVGKGGAETKSIEKSLQIQAAAHLKIRSTAFGVPIGASGKIAHAVTPFAMGDI